MTKESIPHLREAIQSLESKMASLLSEREMLESRLEQAVRLQSPIHRLPNELLASIFVNGVFDTEEEDPLMLSNVMLVCRHWSAVAVDTPMLWSKIVVSNHHSTDRAKIKLARSKSVPLDISIDFNPRLEHGGQVTQNIVYAMDILRPSIYRWRSFSMLLPNRAQAHAALMRCRDPAPLLEVFSVRVFHSMQEDHHASAPPPLFSEFTPRLQSCSFTSFNFGWDLRLVSGLRVLKLGGYWNGFSPSVTAVLDMLRACPQLEELALRNMSDVDSEPVSSTNDLSLTTTDDFFLPNTDSRTVHLPKLIKASFYYSGILRTQTVLGQLVFPALQNLELCYLDNVTPVLKYLAKQSLTSLPLRRLRIESSFFNELKLAMFLRRLPSLTTLELIDAEDVSANLLKGLSTPSSGQTWICPKLDTLDLSGCTALDWDALRTFIESRLPPHSRAANVTLPPSTFVASASAQAMYQHPRGVARGGGSGMVEPKRVKSVDLTRCHQISKEMVQWLKVYIPEVKCEVPKGEGSWGVDR
ncbi:hypothetical protein JAAARDRAFT_122507 [Jaapia argillacea MUCL 33604]|uniref:F-box domain-containing protein n=1 Tax=Jaapia argillacea MUCL 33604 TaxID=933084 RepID=A0A067Q5M8_9AGAM|nr:hypothetical protein JAAARDRAFT_122507 [Jaapia argillacea MUCL 33604]